jgi:hypothetical protein
MGFSHRDSLAGRAGRIHGSLIMARKSKAMFRHTMAIAWCIYSRLFGNLSPSNKVLVLELPMFSIGPVRTVWGELKPCFVRIRYGLEWRDGEDEN